MEEEKKSGRAEGTDVQVQPSPIERIMQALGQGIDPDKIGQMMDYQERWEANQARQAYHTAMSAFKLNPPEIIKDKATIFLVQKMQSIALLR